MKPGYLKRSIVVFDIETGSLPEEKILDIAGEFNESNVKTGNLGIEKAMEKILKAKTDHLSNLVEKAPLNAEYGVVLAIGIKSGGEEIVLWGDEKKILSDFWSRVAHDYQENQTMWVGFNSQNFDLPFLLRRSFIVGAKVPSECVPVSRFWDGNFWKDLFEIWKAGNFKDSISLDRFCRACGLKGKNGSGKYFQQLFKEDREKALEYCLNDIRITYQLAERIFSCLS